MSIVPPAASKAQPPTRCTYLRCDVPPTTIIQPPYGRPWRGCAQHAPAMASALGGTARAIVEAPVSSGNSWDDREGDSWIDKL